ncbi:MAG: hypothetical protein LBN27_10725 [Prevotellaceae bacterium]|jgi:hypothetical protein|nr:hypothetical protein [Prevotellaceae bacterium]
MKKLFLSLIILMSICTLISCNKDEEKCWQFTQDITTECLTNPEEDYYDVLDRIGESYISDVTEYMCDMTKKEAQKFVNEHSGVIIDTLIDIDGQELIFNIKIKTVIKK